MTTNRAPKLSDVSAEALHASSIRLMSEFVQNPSPELADTVMRVLNALSAHPQRFSTPCGFNVYEHAIGQWQSVATDMRMDKAMPAPSKALH